MTEPAGHVQGPVGVTDREPTRAHGLGIDSSWPPSGPPTLAASPLSVRQRHRTDRGPSCPLGAVGGSGGGPTPTRSAPATPAPGWSGRRRSSCRGPRGAVPESAWPLARYPGAGQRLGYRAVRWGRPRSGPGVSETPPPPHCPSALPLTEPRLQGASRARLRVRRRRVLSRTDALGEQEQGSGRRLSIPVRAPTMWPAPQARRRACGSSGLSRECSEGGR